MPATKETSHLVTKLETLISPCCNRPFGKNTINLKECMAATAIRVNGCKWCGELTQ